MGYERRDEEADATPIRATVLLGSVRRGRRSDKVARFLVSQMKELGNVDAELLDLADYPFPILEEKPDAEAPLPGILEEFRKIIADSDGLLIVSPEYKNGMPGALKNALDHLPPGALRRKPVALSTVSAGGFGGLHCLMQLRQVVFALGGLPIAEILPVSNVIEAFDEDSRPDDPGISERARTFTSELVWYARAIRNARTRCKPEATA